MELLISWLILSLAVWVTALVLLGFHIKNFGGAVLVAAIFGVLNTLIGWLLFTLLAIATLGLALLLAFITRWIVMAILLQFTASLTGALKIDSFGQAFLGALIMSAVGTLAQWLLLSAVG